METIKENIATIESILTPRVNQMHEVHVKLYETYGDLKDLGYSDLADLVHTISRMISSETQRLIEFHLMKDA